MRGFIAAAIMYMILVFIISRAFKVWERHWHAHLRQRETEQPDAAGVTDTKGFAKKAASSIFR